MPDEPAADEALVTTARLAQVHNIAPGALKNSVRRIARRLWRANPVVAPYNGGLDVSSWEALSASFEGDDNEMKRLHEWAPEYRREVWAEALAEQGVADPMLADQLAELYPLERRARYHPFPDAKPTLDDLARDFRLGLITNGPDDLQWEKLERTGLEDRFATVVISREVGVMKPDPAIFQIALDKLSVPAAESVYIGDSLTHDVAGAQAAGMKAIWLSRDSSHPDGDARPDATIHVLTEVRSALARVEKTPVG